VSGDRRVRVRACAKINLSLRVLGVRPDGYHEVRTVLQSLALHDRLTFESTRGPFTLATSRADCPADRTNLVWRAAELVWGAARRRGRPSGLRVSVDKRIPVQAGLGGGSSDAAAALRVFREIWCPVLPPSRLEALAMQLGTDVPFFLRGGTALGVERGDRLFALSESGPQWVVIVQPDFGVSTADVYRWFDERTAPAHPTRRGNRPGGPYGEGGNDLEPPVAAHHPEVRRIVQALGRRGAAWAAMSGSGSACFGLFPSAPAARAAAAAVRARWPTTWLTRTLSARQYARWSAPMVGPDLPGAKPIGYT
jgi:4-diphosphocytidyl-2-C-methyl-D-erythritol kinase